MIKVTLESNHFPRYHSVQGLTDRMFDSLDEAIAAMRKRSSRNRKLATPDDETTVARYQTAWTDCGSHLVAIMSLIDDN